ncbi:CCDC174 family protein, partial [Aspergillus saccharolyticus JOP 1030-1]
NLYGHHPRKKPDNNTGPPSASTLAFTTTLSNLIARRDPQTLSATATPSTSAKVSTGRPRPSKHTTHDKDAIFARPNRGAQKRAARDLLIEDDDHRDTAMSQVHRQSSELGGKVDEAVLQRSKRRMQEKARVYEDLKRGLYLGAGESDSDEGVGNGGGAGEEGVGEGERYLRRLRRKEREGLVDFDRKWADTQLHDDLSGEEGEGDGDDASIVSYEDELGRTRRGTRAEAAEAARLKGANEDGAEAGERWRPRRPENLIYGVTVQSQAFQPDVRMADLAKRRDRSVTPPEETHYDADAEVRNRGTGFYAFAKDEDTRRKQMEELRAAREETQREREEKSQKRAKREEARNQRMMKVEELRSKRRAEMFLAGLGDVG